MTVDIGDFSACAIFRQLIPCVRKLAPRRAGKRAVGAPGAFPWPLRADPGPNALPDNSPLHLRKCREQVQQKLGHRALGAGVDGLRRAKEPDSEADTSSWIDRTQCATLRPQRSSFQTSTASNLRSRASRKELGRAAAGWPRRR